MAKYYNTKIDHSKHACEIRQQQRIFKKFSIALMNLPDESATIYYQIWCLDCEKPVAGLTHDEAWRAYRAGAPFGPLRFKIKNSRYKAIERNANSHTK